MISSLRHSLTSSPHSLNELAKAAAIGVQENSNRNGLNCFVRGTIDDSAVKASISRLASSNPKPLDGIPIAVKDNLCMKGFPTTAASRMLDSWTCPYDATVVSRLKDAGAMIVGKTNMDEFGMGAGSIHSVHGPVLNPCDLACTAGGSSGGSAAAVASGLVVAALASDTGGSARLPAAYTGCVGLRPTYGRTSRWGLIAHANSLDVPGIIAGTADDVRLVLDAIEGEDGRDAMMMPAPTTTSSNSQLTVGIADEHHVEELSQTMLDAWQAAIDALEQSGVQVVRISLPHTKHSVPCYYVISTAEASSNMARYDGIHFGFQHGDMTETRTLGFGDEVQRRILCGTLVLSSECRDSHYMQALRVRSLVRDDYLRAFRSVDAVLSPTALGPAWRLDSPPSPAEAWAHDIYTAPAALAGLPALSVPARGVDGLPLGLHLTAAPWQERVLFELADRL